jgi:hypothetical protein
MLGRRPAATEETPEQTLVALETAAGKGRPTPKRSDSRKARRNATPKTRKEAAALQRERGREQRRLARQALVTGDERNLPARDAGPEKRLARDVVDSRFTAGQVLFALILAGFLLSILNVPIVKLLANLLALLALTLLVVDGARNGRRAKVAVMAQFNLSPDQVRGISSYAFMRAMLPRRFRRPPPKVERGAKIF